MKSRRLIALVFGAGIALAMLPAIVAAQGSTTVSPGGTVSSGGGTTTGGGGTSSGTGVSAAVGSGLVTSVATIAASSGTPSATTIASNANVFAPSYVNYFTLGLPQNYQTKFGAQNTSGMKGAFGKYIYVPNPSASTGTTTAVSNQGTGFTTFGQPRAPAYSTGFAETFPILTPDLARVSLDVSDAISGSSMLKNKNAIRVNMNGAIVYLNGVVGSETERATAEGMVRMTPGVQGVQNNLQIDPSRK